MRVLATAFLALFYCAFPAMAAEMTETPTFVYGVKAGRLPPVDKRVPEEPSVVDLPGAGKVIGQHGGELKLLMGKQKDTRMMNVYGYARLITIDEKFRFIADVVKSYEVRDGREFTFYLRRGHKWSDGQPFTAEDFRYYWADVANNKKLNPGGLPQTMLVENRPPVFEVIDETTVRYTWHKPNREFIPWIADSRPLQLYRPAHYLKQFHIDHGNREEIEKLVQAEHRLDWADLHASRDHWYRMDNPDLPTLQPWMNTTSPPSVRFVYVRNPYYHRIDTEGRQLPYIDRVILQLGETKLIPAKSGSGETDLQGRYLRLDHYTFLKEGEARHNYSVNLWKMGRGAAIALYPNLNVNDADWRELLRDVRFRRALSLAIDRHEINQAVYYGLANEGNNTVLPTSPLFRPELSKAWANFDIKKANALLDEMGLTERNGDGIRLMKSGRPLIVTVDTAGESTEEVDVLELVHDSWLKAGIKLLTRPAQREVFRQRIFAGQTIISTWPGISNGIPVASMSPNELAPTSKYQLQWPQWGLWCQTNGKLGHKPELPEVMRLYDLYNEWQSAPQEEDQERIWTEMLDIHAEQVYTIGIVNSTLQPIVVNNRLRNVPVKAFYNWSPGAYFGMYKPDTFWFAK